MPDAEVKAAFERGDSVIADWAVRAYESMYGGPGTLTACAKPEPGQPEPAAVEMSATSALHTACVDPSIARWLGLSGALPKPDPVNYQAMFVACIPVYRPVLMLGRPGPSPERSELTAMYDDATDRAYSAASEEVFRINHQVPRPIPFKWTLSLLAIPMPATSRAPDGPVAPNPVGGAPAWHSQRSPSGAWTWQAPVRLPGSTPAGRVSLIQTGAAPRSLVASPDRFPGTLMTGWPGPGAVPPRDATVTAGEFEGGESDDPAVDVEVRLGDWVGRWSEPGWTTLTPPDRPDPAPPMITGQLVRSAAPEVGTDPRSPGSLRLDVALPPSNTIAARDVGSVEVESTGGTSKKLEVTGGQRRWTVVLPAPDTRPGEQRAVRATARAVDRAGRRSQPASCEIQVSDPRPVRAPTVGTRMLLTSRRTNSDEVSVTLAVRAPAGSGGAVSYRFVIASERTLRAEVAALAGLDDTTPRARRAAALVKNGGRREHYRWAVDQPVVAVQEGSVRVARVCLRIPAGSPDLMLVKALPMTGPVGPDGLPTEGVSTPFTAIRATAIAVPGSDVPPTPRLRTSLDTAGNIVADVVVDGLDPAILRRLSGPPQVRIVELIAGAGEPRFAPVVVNATALTVDGDPDRSATLRAHGSVIVPDAPTWRRIGLAAAVRYPAEDTVMPEAEVVPDPELVADGPQPDRVDSPWGPYSATSWIAVPGADHPTLRDTSTDSRVSVAVDDPPASGEWTLETFYGAVDGPLSESTTVPLSGGESIVDTVPDGTRQYAVRIVDPFGRPGEPVGLGVDL
ncbi:MAG: hypothetical protein QM658_06295 [Gordonia sp. (in: high G+C Gram-positive bacteria)]